MPGCDRIAVSIHSNIQMEVLIDNPKALISDLRWCSCNIFPAQEHTMDVITHDKSAAVFTWNIESLEEYWDYILNVLI